MTQPFTVARLEPRRFETGIDDLDQLRRHAEPPHHVVLHETRVGGEQAETAFAKLEGVHPSDGVVGRQRRACGRFMRRVDAVVEAQEVLIEEVSVPVHEIEASDHPARGRRESPALEPRPPGPAKDGARRRPDGEDGLAVQLLREHVDFPIRVGRGAGLLEDDAGRARETFHSSGDERKS
ncbi:MAG: hypothetical protein A2X40_10110 [Elusimicrobia bacterium GWC2_65_9]|nr:MAG: hypothetical protein A2X40_10110 [Elusimicrobia bacterium GWC2_65_9]